MSERSTGGMERENPLEEIVGEKITNVAYNGDYYTPYTLVLEDGTHIIARGILEQSEEQ